MYNCKNFYSILFAVSFSFAVSGCSSSYVKAKTVTSASAYPAVIERGKKDNRSFILHSGINVYTIAALQLDRAKNNVEVQLAKLDSLHIVRVEDLNSNKLVGDKKQFFSGEIHLYMQDSVSYLLEEPYTIPLQKVARIDVVGKG